MAILILTLTEIDKALKEGRAALTLKWCRDMSHMEKEKALYAKAVRSGPDR
jgi:hypothetical protein